MSFLSKILKIAEDKSHDIREDIEEKILEVVDEAEKKIVKLVPDALEGVVAPIINEAFEPLKQVIDKIDGEDDI